MSDSRLSYLFYKVVDGTADEAERLELAGLAVQPANEAALRELMEEGWETFAGERQLFSQVESVLMLKKALNADDRPSSLAPVRRMPFLRRWGWVAASILLVVATALFYIVSSERRTTGSGRSIVNAPEIPPGREGAILTLADGSRVRLDSLGNGVIAMQSGAPVMLQDGQLAYDQRATVAGEAGYNTMTTPKGRQFQLLLPDGTRVWLNAASSIRYPIAFTGNERRVAIRGEAYLEVAQDTRLPFRVNVNDQAEVEVLGTHFNVNAYEDEENINTTLLEGAVAVSLVTGKVGESASVSAGLSADRQQRSSPLNDRDQRSAPLNDRDQADRQVRTGNRVVLKPGQQAQILNTADNRSGAAAENGIAVRNADIETIMAWKNGDFIFNGEDFKTTMRKIARWYDVDIVYGPGLRQDIELGGWISRKSRLSDVLDRIEQAGKVNFKLEGRKIIITN